MLGEPIRARPPTATTPSLELVRPERGEDRDVLEAEPHDERAGRPAAVIVCHAVRPGRPLALLEQLAAGLAVRTSGAGHAAAPRRAVARLPDAPPMGRVEVTLPPRGPDDAPREVHLYEIDATPPAARPASVAGVLAVGLGAALRGLGCALRGGFTRWMFGVRQPLALPPRRIVQLAIATAAVLDGAVSLALATLLVGARLVALLVPAAASAAAAVEGAFVWCASALVLLGLAALATVRGHEGDVARRPSALARAIAGATAGAVLAAAALGATEVAARWRTVHFADASLVILAAALVVIAAALLAGRGFGSMAAYVGAPHVRVALRRRAHDAASAVYGACVADGRRPLYADVLVLGHGLGSALAFDVLDGGAAAHAGIAGAGDVAGRTRLFATIGSPLDKLAVMLHDRATADGAAATPGAAVLARYGDRPVRWVNLWSPFDWVSGSLEYFDEHPIRAEHALRAVENVVDDDAPRDPVRAHRGYWDRRALRDLLYVELAAAPRAAAR